MPIGSVVPGLTGCVSELAGQVSGVSVVRVRDDIPLPIPLDVDNPDEVGVDRGPTSQLAVEEGGDPRDGPVTEVGEGGGQGHGAPGRRGSHPG